MVFLVLPLMKLLIIYLMNKKHAPITTGQPLLQMRVCGFVLFPQLSSDIHDKCDCLRKKNSRGPGVGCLTCLLVLDFTVLKTSYLNVLEMAEN